MSLEKTFGNVKKPAEEKQLEVITTKEATIKDLENYFEKNKYEGWLISLDECKEYFGSCMNFLKSFKLNPKIIAEFNKNISSMEEKESFGLYLSTMIQTSYNQGFNNFIFGEVYANCFGSFLKAQPKKQIKIEIKKELKGNYSLWRAKNCSLTINTLEGDSSLCVANSCLAEIKKYQGIEFGYFMKNCTIKSENKKTIELIKDQADVEADLGWNNKFELKR